MLHIGIPDVVKMYSCRTFPGQFDERILFELQVCRMRWTQPHRLSFAVEADLRTPRFRHLLSPSWIRIVTRSPADLPQMAFHAVFAARLYAFVERVAFRRHRRMLWKHRRPVERRTSPRKVGKHGIEPILFKQLYGGIPIPPFAEPPRRMTPESAPFAFLRRQARHPFLILARLRIYFGFGGIEKSLP